MSLDFAREFMTLITSRKRLSSVKMGFKGLFLADHNHAIRPIQQLSIYSTGILVVPESRAVKETGLLLGYLRWFVPIALSAMGLLYVLGETFIRHEPVEPNARLRIIIGVILLCVVGPIITYVGLNWAWNTTEQLRKVEHSQRQQNRRLRTIADISQSVNQSLNSEQVIDNALTKLLELVDVESAAIWLSNNGHFELKAAKGISDQFRSEEAVLSLSQCLCGQSVEEGIPLTLDDIRCGQEFLAARCSCEQFSAAIGAPIRTTEDIVGVIEVGTNRPRVFDEYDRELLGTVGYHIGTAVEKAVLHQELQLINQNLEQRVAKRTSELLDMQAQLAERAAVLEELLSRVVQVEEETRAQIASDLHDGIQQLIAGAQYEAEAAREAVRLGSADSEKEILRLQEILLDIQREMRVAVFNLRPVTLDNHGLVGALQECVRDFRRSSPVDCKLTVSGQPVRFDPEAELAAFRIAQESLNNVEAHGEATCAEVKVEFKPSRLLLEINDDGIGIPDLNCASSAKPKLGLLGMRERAEHAGGELLVDSEPGLGTKISLQLPLNGELG